MRRLTRLERTFAIVWLIIAVVVWNGMYDLRISLGIREYLLETALYRSGRGPETVMAEAMRHTVRDAVAVASLWGGTILLAGVGTVLALGRRSPGA